MGRISDTQVHYFLKPEPTKKLLRGDIDVKDITSNDLDLNLEQKGVDMRIGVDISSLVFKHQVDQIILISGDSDFVPAAKQARREGIDFILDPMHSPIKDDLFEHIDGIRTPNMIDNRCKENDTTPEAPIVQQDLEQKPSTHNSV